MIIAEPTAVSLIQLQNPNSEQLLAAINKCVAEDSLLMLDQGKYLLLGKEIEITEQIVLYFNKKLLPQAEKIFSNCALAYFDQTELIIYANKIYLKDNHLTITVNEEKQLQLVFIPAITSNKKIIFRLEDNSIATIDTEGILKGIKEGKTFLYIISNNIGLTYQIKVVNNQKNNKTATLLKLVILIAVAIYLLIHFS